MQDRLLHCLLSSGQIITLFTQFRTDFFLFYEAKARNFFPTLGGQIIYFIYKKLQSSERCIRKLISCHCLDKTRTRCNDFLFLITDDRDFRPQTYTNGLVFRECKHIKNIFEDVYFTKNSFHITLKSTIRTGYTSYKKFSSTEIR